MSRTIWQRLLIVTVFIFLGMLIAQGVTSSPFAQSLPWLFYLIAAIISIIVAGTVVYFSGRIEQRSSRPAASISERQRQEAELLQLNQELEGRTREQTAELARLNVELALQIAMHQQAEEIAHASEERFRNMADNIQEGLTIIEGDRIVYRNDRVCEIFGDCPGPDIQQRILVFAAPEEQERLQKILHQAVTVGRFPEKLEYWIVRKDATRRCIRERYSHSDTLGVVRTFILTADVTERVQAYQSLEQAVTDRTLELSTVLDISKKIASTLELEPLLYLILDQIQSIIPYSGAAIFTLDNEIMEVVAFQVPNMPRQDRPLYLSLRNAGPYQQVILEKNILIIDDVNGDPPLARAIQETSDAPLPISFSHARSWIGIPLVIRDHVTGLLSLTHSQPNYYTPQHARLALTITNQVAVAIENARLYEQAQNLATLEERQRIARELHDSVTQLLYGICLYCTATSRMIKGGNFDQVEQNLAEIKDNALQALQEMRVLIFELNPPMLQKGGLVTALQSSLESIETRAGLQTELTAEVVNRLPRSIEAELYRIAMEALNNLVRYARARKVTVDLRAVDGKVYLEICDNGVGFDLVQAKTGGGLGLHNMEQRARQIGGSLEIISAPGTGTRIRIEAPITADRVEHSRSAPVVSEMA